jgi:hypothetical protein
MPLKGTTAPDDVESLSGLSTEIKRQSEMIGYINAFHLYYWIAFSIIPLVWLAPLKPQN